MTDNIQEDTIEKTEQETPETESTEVEKAVETPEVAAEEATEEVSEETPEPDTSEETKEKEVDSDEKKDVEKAAEETNEKVATDTDTDVQEDAVTTPDDTSVNDAFDDNEGLILISNDVPETAHWYVVHTYAGHEKKVAVTLKQRAESGGYTDRVFKVFIPHQQKIVISDGKKRSVDERLFPGYVIVLMDMSDDAWLLVRSTRGVTGFVGMGSTPTPLPEQEVKTLMKFATMEAPKFEAKFTIGDSVKIMEGPFRDFLGKVDQVNDDQGKVKVLVSVFGRETPVELDFIQVQNI